MGGPNTQYMDSGVGQTAASGSSGPKSGGSQPSGSGIGAAVGGLIGMFASAEERKNARHSMDMAVEELLSVGLPPDLSSPVAIQHLKSVGKYTPQLEQAIDLGITQTEQIQEDPNLKAQQLRSLSALEKLSQSGLTPAQQAALQQERMQGEADEQSRQAALMQQLQARGQGGSGAEIAARLQSSQSAANRGSQAGLDAVGISSQSAQNALQQLGNQAGNVRQQDFGVAKDKASAADLRSRFNTEGAMGRQTTNVRAQNAGQERNLSRDEFIADSNVGIDNKELYRQNQAKRDFFDDSMVRAKMRSGAYTTRGQTQQGAADATAKQWAQGGEAVGQVGQAVAMSDIRSKKNISEADSKSFLDKLNGYEYEYKEPEKHGSGKKMGVMAQDLEKVIPEAVEENEEGLKTIDYNKVGGHMLASLTEMNKRLKRLEGN
jgi:hypothetical protein